MINDLKKELMELSDKKYQAFSSKLLPNTDNIMLATFIPNIECIIAKNRGIMKNIAICLNSALLIIFCR